MHRFHKIAAALAAFGRDRARSCSALWREHRSFPQVPDGCARNAGEVRAAARLAGGGFIARPAWVWSDDVFIPRIVGVLWGDWSWSG